MLAAGITINGLPIMLSRAYATGPSIPNLDVYNEDCVIGGVGSFVIAIKESRTVQRGDPHQAGPGDRRPADQAAHGAGAGKVAVRL